MTDNTPPIIALAMAVRQAKGLHLRVFGPAAEKVGACEHSYAKDADQMARWIAACDRNGYEYEVVQ